MRVLLTTDAVGGVWTFTCELSQGLLRSGCDVALACVGPAPSHSQRRWVSGMKDAWSNRFQYAHVDAPLEWMQENELAWTAAAATLQALACDFGADLIHSSQYCAGALQTELPVVVTAHSDVLSWAANSRLEPLESSTWLRTYRELVSAGLEQASAVVAPTNWMLDALAMNFKLPAKRRAISNGRAVPEMTAMTKKLQAVSCGRLWDEAKNIAMLNEIDAAMPLLVAGETEHDGAALSRIPAGPIFLGTLGETALIDLFRQSAVYICTSVYEPFGLAALEAALCGCAVVANDIASLREVWGDAALYFTDAHSLSEALRRLSVDGDLLAECQLSCAARAARYTPEAMTSAYVALYRECVAAREVSYAA